MLDLKFIRENPEKVKENIAKKHETAEVDNVLSLDQKRRELIQETEQLKNKRNVVSKEIAELKRNKQDADDKIASMKEVSERIKNLDDALRNIDEDINEHLLRIPNMLHDSVPEGKTEEDNIEIKAWQSPKEPIDMNHIEISSKFVILDFERGAKVSGAGFAFYVGKGAALERALLNYMIEQQTGRNGYTEVIPPFVVNRNSMTGTGQLPKMAEDMYHVQSDDLYLIPTAEVPLTNFYSNEVLKFTDLPVNVCGASPCFRREAGSYGKDVHGFLRVHQFNKVELIKICLPENSEDELEKITADAESVLEALNLPYRRLLLSSGDTSFASSKTYDLEVWTPGEKQWLEVSSCSNFTDFQARRAKIRFKRDPNSKPEFVHTLNGSGLATSRLMVALIENNFDGNQINIPEPLRKYTGFDYIN